MHKNTAEQDAIIREAQSSSDNLLITARAGAAKTTTLILVAEAVYVPTLALAFNKKIAEEMKSRMPAHVTCMTLNSIGHRAWTNFIGKRPNLDPQKIYGLLRTVLENYAGGDADYLQEIFSDLIDGIKTAKVQGYLPSGVNSHARPLISDDSFFEILEFKVGSLEKEVIDAVMAENFRQAMKGQIDYDDQIYMPALMKVSFDKFALTMIDEAQDLSPINHVVLQKIVGPRRLIAVGDPCQAIYGFRGASESSMSELRSMFSMRDLSLTICFRSAKRIIENAHWRAPDMQWAPWAAEGEVRRLSAWDSSMLQSGDAIICRNNAPLFRMALELLRARLHPEIASGDVIKGLMAIMKKLGKGSLDSENALVELERWKQAELRRSRNPQRIVDQAECITLFLYERPTLGAAMAYLDDISKRAGKIKLMTGHRSKGLEFDRVWFLDQHLVRPDGQDLNIKYVIETRAKQCLTYVESETWGMIDGEAQEPLGLEDLRMEDDL